MDLLSFLAGAMAGAGFICLILMFAFFAWCKSLADATMQSRNESVKQFTEAVKKNMQDAVVGRSFGSGHDGNGNTH